MSFLERLLHGIQTREEIERKAQASAADKAEREARTIIAARESTLSEESTRQSVIAQEIKDTLERYSVKERLEAIRDGVWKVGEIRPNGSNNDGYYLIHTYPAAIPIMVRGTWTVPTYESPASGSGGPKEWTYSGWTHNGFFKEGRRFDAVVIRAKATTHKSPGSSKFTATSSKLVFDAGGGWYGPEPKDNFDWHYVPMEYRSSFVENHKHFYGYGEIGVSSPSYLEMVITDYCHDIITNKRLSTSFYKFTEHSRLPLEAQAEEQNNLMDLRQAGKIKG